MNVVERAEYLEAEAKRLKAARLAEKDLGWWAQQIARLAKRGERSCSNDGAGFFYYHPARANGYYLQALSKLLGPGFSVDFGRGLFCTGTDAQPFDCVKVSW